MYRWVLYKCWVFRYYVYLSSTTVVHVKTAQKRPSVDHRLSRLYTSPTILRRWRSSQQDSRSRHSGYMINGNSNNSAASLLHHLSTHSITHVPDGFTVINGRKKSPVMTVFFPRNLASSQLLKTFFVCLILRRTGDFLFFDEPCINWFTYLLTYLLTRENMTM